MNKAQKQFIYDKVFKSIIKSNILRWDFVSDHWSNNAHDYLKIFSLFADYDRPVFKAMVGAFTVANSEYGHKKFNLTTAENLVTEYEVKINELVEDGKLILTEPDIPKTIEVLIMEYYKNGQMINLTKEEIKIQQAFEAANALWS